MEGRVLGEIIYKFNLEAKKDNYDFSNLPDSKSYKISLQFSPTADPSTWLESLSKHLNSNASQFFVGGAIATVNIKNQNINIQIYNATSRRSLMLHMAENYERRNGNRPLSTIKQYIYARYKIN